MGFLQSSTLIRWWEPPFFGLRHRSRNGRRAWLQRLCSLLFLGACALGYLAYREPGRVSAATLPMYLGGLGVIALVAATVPKFDTRDVHVNDTGILAAGLFGILSFGEDAAIPFSRVAWCEIVSPAQSGRSFGLLRVTTDKASVPEFGIPASVDLVALGGILSGRGVEIRRAGD